MGGLLRRRQGPFSRSNFRRGFSHPEASEATNQKKDASVGARGCGQIEEIAGEYAGDTARRGCRMNRPGERIKAIGSVELDIPGGHVAKAAIAELDAVVQRGLEGAAITLLVNPAGDLERAALARILERKTDNTRDRIAGLLRCTCWLKSVCLADRSSSPMSTSTGMRRSTCVGGLPRKPTTVIGASDSASVAVLESASSGGVVSALWAWAVTGISAATATVTSSSVWLLLAFPPAFCCMQCFKFAG